MAYSVYFAGMDRYQPQKNCQKHSSWSFRGFETIIYCTGCSNSHAQNSNLQLGGGFKYFLFSTLFGEVFQFD